MGVDGSKASYDTGTDADEAALDLHLSFTTRHNSKSSVESTRGTSAAPPSSSIMSTSSPGAVGMRGTHDEDERTADVVSADNASSFNFATVEDGWAVRKTVSLWVLRRSWYALGGARCGFAVDIQGISGQAY